MRWIDTDKKKKKNFSSYVRNSEWSVCKVIYEEGLPTIWGNAQIYTIHTVYEEAVSHTWLCNRSLLDFLILYMRIFFFFVSVWSLWNPEFSCTVCRERWWWIMMEVILYMKIRDIDSNEKILTGDEKGWVTAISN